MAIKWGISADRADMPVSLVGCNSTSIAYWLNWTAFANDDKVNLCYNAVNFTFMSYPNGSSPANWSIWLRGSSGNSTYNAFTRPTALAGTWMHVVINLSYSGPTIQLYINGVAASGAGSGGTGSGSGSGPFSDSFFTPFYWSPGGNYGLGSMAECSIWGGSTRDMLTAADIQQLAKGQSPLKIPSKRLLAYYPMDNGDRQSYSRNIVNPIKIVLGTSPLPNALPVTIDSPTLLNQPFVADVAIGMSSGVEVSTVYIDLDAPGTESAQRVDSGSIYVNLDCSGVDGIQTFDAASFYIDISIHTCEWYTPVPKSEFLFNAYTVWSQQESTKWSAAASSQWQWTVEPVEKLVEEFCTVLV